MTASPVQQAFLAWEARRLSALPILSHRPMDRTVLDVPQDHIARLGLPYPAIRDTLTMGPLPSAIRVRKERFKVILVPHLVCSAPRDSTPMQKQRRNVSLVKRVTSVTTAARFLCYARRATIQKLEKAIVVLASKVITAVRE